jgi:hypothetical protein
MREGLGLALFDFAVNSGVARAAKTLQAILGVKRDGMVGPITLRALGEHVAARGVGALIAALSDSPLGFLKALSIFPIFGRGWTKRVTATRALALSLSPADPVSSQDRSNSMDFLSGYRTYIVALIMVIIGVAQALGLDVPSFEGHSGGQLVVEGLAILFLRKGLKGDIGNA